MSGNTRLLHFFVFPNSKNEPDHETVAFFHTSKHQKRARQRTNQKSNFDRPQKQGVPVLQSYSKRTIFWPSWGGPQEGPSERCFPESQKRADLRILRHFRVSDHRDPRILRHFRVCKAAKASGNTRLSHFFVFSDSQSQPAQHTQSSSLNRPQKQSFPLLQSY